MSRWFHVRTSELAFWLVTEPDSSVIKYGLTWMRGKTLQEVKPWLLEQRARVVECNKPEQ